MEASSIDEAPLKIRVEHSKDAKLKIMVSCWIFCTARHNKIKPSTCWVQPHARTLSAAPRPSESMKSKGTFSPVAVSAVIALEQSHMPRVCDSTVCPTENPSASPSSWFIRNDFPLRYRPATIVTAANHETWYCAQKTSSQ
jgi:hypothetical protein